MSKGTRRTRRRKGRRTKSCNCTICGCKVCKCNMKNRRMRSLRRKGQKGGFEVLGVELNPYTRFFGKKDKKDNNDPKSVDALPNSNVAGSPANDPSVSPPSASPSSMSSSSASPSSASPSSSVSMTQTATPSQSLSNSPDFCERCREAHRDGRCTLSIDEAGSGILTGAQKAATKMLNEGKQTLEDTAKNVQKQASNALIDSGLKVRPETSTPVSKTPATQGGGARKRRRKSRKGKKSRKTRRKSRRAKKGRKGRKSRRRRRRRR